MLLLACHPNLCTHAHAPAAQVSYTVSVFIADTTGDFKIVTMNVTLAVSAEVSGLYVHLKRACSCSAGMSLPAPCQACALHASAALCIS